MKNRGFTVVEIMVAILIFAVGLTGAFVLANTAISLSLRSKQEIIATNLIREQLELVKNVRDSNWLSLRDWKSIASFSNCPSPLCSFETGAWYHIENNFDDTKPIIIEKLHGNFSDSGARKSMIIQGVNNNTLNTLRLCLDEKGRYRNCSNGGNKTPYFTYLKISPVTTKDASGNDFEVPGIFEATAYMTAIEGGYREFYFSTLISDWKK